MRRLLLLMLGVLLISAQLLAQNRTITGKITDEQGNGIANSSVVVKGTNVGTTTNNEGFFTLSVPGNAKALIVSYIGLGEKEISLSSSSNYRITLSAAVRDMSEVVVVAYGTQKRSDITGSIATIKSADIENKPFTSIDKALQGQIPGLQSIAASGAPGANQFIRIRGITSITGNNAPLWVIDGIIATANGITQQTTTSNILATLNPNDIESISVLKDAAASSIYGSRAANGVIIITTKKGRAGKTKVRFDTEAGQSDIAYINDKYTPLNAQQYLDITREGLVNLGVTQAQINATLTALGYGNGQDYNWFNAVTRKGSQQQYNISASGGDNRTSFYISGGYFKQQGTVIASDLNRYTTDIKISNKVNDKLTVGANLNIGYVGQNTPLAGGAFGNPVLTSFFLLPTKNAYKPDGTFNILTPDFPTSSLFNTVALANMDRRFLKETSLRGNGYAEYNFLDNLKFRTSFSGELNLAEEDQYNNPLYGDGFTTSPTTTGRAISGYTRIFNWVWTNTLDIHQNITKNGDLNFNAKAGYEGQRNKVYQTQLQAKGFAPNLLLKYPSSGATPSTASGAPSEFTFASEFGIADVHYKDKYILSGSFRRDGSSKFSPNFKYGNFWSVGASWNADKEDFIQNISFISQLKLRASYGSNGNVTTGNYDYFASYAYGISYNSAPGSAPSNVGAPDLTWELNKPLNIGIDLGILKNRLSITADWYKRKSIDLLLAVPLPPTSGFISQQRNVGSMENKGIELSFNGVPVQTQNFTWTSNFNFARNKNKVLNMPSPIIGTFIIKPGLDVQSFYTRVYAGVDPANGDPLWYADSSRKTTTNNWSSAQRVAYGSASPKFFGGWANTFNFKGFTLEAQFTYQFGNLVQDSWASYYLGGGFGATFNKIKRVLDRWQKPGDVTDIPKYVYGGNQSFQNFSSFYLAKGDFIRLRNLQFGYDIPKSIVSKAKISNAFFYVRGTNLWTWVKDKHLGFDPEQGVSSQTNLDVMIPKTITVGINLGF